MQVFKQKSMSKLTPKKLLFLVAVALCSLLFYALGVVTGFFGSPEFSFFWVVTNQTSYDIGYAVLTSVIVSGVIISVYYLFRKFNVKFEAVFSKQKILVISILTVYGLIFYTVGIATNFFSAHVFSIFWIVNRQTSYELAYGVGGAAITLSIATLAAYFLKN
jgi:hypothetical protein